MIDMNVWGWPQWTWVALIVVNLFLTGLMHGKPRPPLNGFASLCGYVFGAFVLFSGGFFA